MSYETASYLALGVAGVIGLVLLLLRFVPRTPEAGAAMNEAMYQGGALEGAWPTAPKIEENQS